MRSIEIFDGLAALGLSITERNTMRMPNEDTEMRSATSFIRPIAIEVELSAKSARRLDEILRAWRRSLSARQFARVLYRCAPAALPFVSRAVARIGSDWGLEVEQLSGGPTAPPSADCPPDGVAPAPQPRPRSGVQRTSILY